MSTIEDVYRKIKAEEEKGQMERERRSREPEEQRSIVFSVLGKSGAKDIELQDGYTINFTYEGLRVHLRIKEGDNDGFELSGEMHKTPLTDMEKKYVRYAYDMMKSGARGEFQGLLNYRQFMFGGQSKDTAKAVMELAHLPLEEVLKIQDSDGLVSDGLVNFLHL